MPIAALERPTGAPRAPSAYDLCWHLAQPDLPLRAPSADRALLTLRSMAALRGGALGHADLPLVSDPLARAILVEALTHRTVTSAANAAMAVCGDSKRSVDDVLLAGIAGVAFVGALSQAGQIKPQVTLAEMDAAWLGASYASLLARRAGANGSAVPITASELAKARRADRLRERALDEPARSRFSAYRNDAVARLLGVAAVGGTSPEALALARSSVDASIGAPYDEVARFTTVPAALDEAQRSAALVGRLVQERRPAIIAAAAEDQARVLGELTVTRRIAQELHALGLLEPLTSGRVAIGVRSHVLISLASAIGAVVDHVLGKGVSSSPIVSVGLGGSAFSSKAGHGDSLRTPEEHLAALTNDMAGWCKEAESTKRPLVVLGDGPDAALAAIGAASSSTTPVGYVEVTAGGLNVLREQLRLSPTNALPMNVFTLADTALKHRFESDVIGRWLVNHTEENLQRLRLPGLSQRPAVIIGYGSSIGPGVARALRQSVGATPMVAVDVAPTSVARAEADLVPAALRGPNDALPYGGVYFSCAGRDATLNLRLLSQLPNGAYVVNCASKNEINRRELVAALRGQVPGVRARTVDDDLLPEHRTIELTFPDGRRIYVAKMGEPSFDGIIDKERKMVDMLMASILVSLTLAAQRLLQAPGERKITSLSAEWQNRIAQLIVETYGA